MAGNNKAQDVGLVLHYTGFHPGRNVISFQIDATGGLSPSPLGVVRDLVSGGDSDTVATKKLNELKALLEKEKDKFPQGTSIRGPRVGDDGSGHQLHTLLFDVPLGDGKMPARLRAGAKGLEVAEELASQWAKDNLSGANKTLGIKFGDTVISASAGFAGRVKDDRDVATGAAQGL